MCKKKEIQILIEKSVRDDGAKHILQTVFNQLMKKQRTEYIQAAEYERSDKVLANVMVTMNEAGQPV